MKHTKLQKLLSIVLAITMIVGLMAPAVSAASPEVGPDELPPQVNPQLTNLLGDPSFDVAPIACAASRDPGKWYGRDMNVTCTWTDTNAIAGHSVSLHGKEPAVEQDITGLENGKTYTFTLYVKGSAEKGTSNPVIGVQKYGDGDKEIQKALEFNTTGWTANSIDFTVTGDVTPRVYVWAADMKDVTIYLDDASLTEKTTEPTDPTEPEQSTWEYDRLPQSEISGVVAGSEEVAAEDTPATKAFDGDLSTIWHTKWDKSGEKTIQWSVGDTAKKIGRIEYFRRSGSENGVWENVTVQGRSSADAAWVDLKANVQLKKTDASTVITFEPTMVTDLKVIVNTGVNDFASAAEIRTYEAVEAGAVSKQALRDAYADAKELKAEGYVAESFANLQTVLTETRVVLDNKTADEAAITEATANLRKAVQGLQVDPSKVAEGAPASGTTKEQPFLANTGSSANFRIPSIITLKNQKDTTKNGRVVAAIDARWNHTGDACALDTILSVSDDNGANWKYSFPNFFNDSTNQKATNATAFIDPVMVEAADGTIYMMVDLFPGGVAINTAPRSPKTDSGYRTIGDKKRLVLFEGVGNAQTADNYAYYVGDFKDGFAPVIAKDDTTGTAAYYVDDHYYLYTAADKDHPMYCRQLGSDKFVKQNVFFYNADLHVCDATYLWLIKSTDAGETWSAPMILNEQIRKDQNLDKFYGVGPGAGLSFVDAAGTNVVLLEAYTFETQRTSFIYSSDNGQTWQRAVDATSDMSSESALVQINNTTVRQFYRDYHAELRYTDYTWNPTDKTFTKKGEPQSFAGANKTTNNQLSAIRYSKQIDGKDVILLSTANGGGGNRSHGHVYTLGLEADGNMTLLNTYRVPDTDAKYGYSSLTELANGDVALLYEGSLRNPANGSVGEDIYFKVVPQADLMPHAVAPTEENVTLKKGESKSFAANGEITKETDNTVVKAELTTTKASRAQGKTGTNNDFNGEKVSLTTGLLTFTKQGTTGNSYRISAQVNGNPVYMQLNTGSGGYPLFSTTEKAMELEATPNVAGSFYIKNAGSSRYLYFMPTGENVYDAFNGMADRFEVGSRFMLYRLAEDAQQSSEEIPGFVKVNTLSEIEDGGQYLIVNSLNNALFAMRPATMGGKFNYVMKVDPTPVEEVTASTLKLTGLKAGKASVTVGNTIYNVTVEEDQKPAPEGDAASIGEKNYATLHDAVKEAKAGETVKLLRDVTLGENNELDQPIDVNGTVTLDLNGFKLVGSGKTVFQVAEAGNLTVQDSSEAKTGFIAGIYQNGNLTMQADSLVETIRTSGALTVESGKIYGVVAEGSVTTPHAVAISAKSGSVTLNGGEIIGAAASELVSAEVYGIRNDGADITVDGAEIDAVKLSTEGQSNAHWLRKNSVVKAMQINGGTVTVNSGSVNGGVFTGIDWAADSSSAQAMDITAGSVTINGGTITGNTHRKDDTRAVITISGGALTIRNGEKNSANMADAPRIENKAYAHANDLTDGGTGLSLYVSGTPKVSVAGGVFSNQGGLENVISSVKGILTGGVYSYKFAENMHDPALVAKDYKVEQGELKEDGTWAPGTAHPAAQYRVIPASGLPTEAPTDKPTDQPTEKPEEKTGWVEIDDGWKYRNEDGSYHTGWLQLNGIWYYCDENEFMLTGWQDLSTGRFYFDQWGHMSESRWEMIDGKFYYFNEWGHNAINRWEQVDGLWYWFDAEGQMVIDWNYIDGNWYYFDVHGTMLLDWQYINDGWFYFNESGHMLTGWQYIGGNWFYLNASGYMLTGWQYIDGNWFYMNEWGQMVTDWQYIDGNWFYFNESGHMLTGWQYIGGNWFYLNESGHMMTGWQYLGGYWYYMDQSGHMVTGDYQVDGVWYSFNESGCMV